MRLQRVLLAVVLLVAGVALALFAMNRPSIDDPEFEARPAGPATPEQVARGAYLARAGDCAACHTVRGGVPYAGGRGIETPFGTVYSSNLTPDAATGIGLWTPAQFWHALHEGRSADGRLLYPAFPYPNYTRVTREDAEALYAYLRSLAPVSQPRRPHDLRFPYDSQLALAAWRVLFFQPAIERGSPTHSAEWNRGAYLVQGLGHCNACHASRNILGATPGPLDLGGGIIPVQNWYAPALTSADEAGVADWELQEIVDLLKSGRSARGSALGPMGDVVRQSTQHLSDADLRAMATFLKALPQHPEPAPAAIAVPDERGRKLYAQHCAQCHGDNGEGAPGAYARLAGNRAVTMDPPANPVRMLVGGGFPPSTAGNPRPYGMPPFATLLSSEEIAAVLTYVRGSWGNRGAPVSTLQVERYRSGASEP
jgi:mono/diheme cytochrome c family protein